MKTYTLHTLRHDNTTQCGIVDSSRLYWHRIGTPAHVRDWLAPCKRCAKTKLHTSL